MTCLAHLQHTSNVLYKNISSNPKLKKKDNLQKYPSKI